MANVKERYVVGDQGNRTDVVLPIEDYERMQKELARLPAEASGSSRTSRGGMRRSGVGRPEVQYRLSALGDELFPQRERKLLRGLG